MANETKIAHLINPQVLGDLIDRKLTDNMVFAPLCVIDETLVGTAGNTVTLPAYAYIGDAEDVDELGEIGIAELTASTQKVTVKKAGKGVIFSDEALLSGAFDPPTQAAYQLGTAIKNKLDNDVLASLANATLVQSVVSVTPNEINNALTLLGEDFEGDKYLFVSAATYAVLRDAKEWLPASEIAADTIIKGVVGSIYGCYVKVSNKITATNVAYIVKPGAVYIYLKRGTEVEMARDIIKKSTTITADKHYAVYLGDASKVIKMGAASMVTLTVKQITNIVTNKAKFAITGYPTNLPYGWKAWYAQNLSALATPTVGDTFDNGAGKTHEAFSVEYSEDPLSATDTKYSQILYVDAAGKIRAKGGVKAVATLA